MHGPCECVSQASGHSWRARVGAPERAIWRVKPAQSDTAPRTPMRRAEPSFRSSPARFDLGSRCPSRNRVSESVERASDAVDKDVHVRAEVPVRHHGDVELLCV
jgi:hypothetical protein